MTDFSIIIPHRGSALGLWATIQSCEEDLLCSPHSYNYVVVTNGEKLDSDAESVVRHVEESGRLLAHIHEDAPLSPPAARQRGAQCADGSLLFFFDNHCLVGRKYFGRAVADFDQLPIDMLHSSTVFYAGQGVHYHYRLKLDYNFWAESSTVAEREHKPYQLAAGGHGGFVVRKSVWDEVGGYGPEDLLQGYGGEELLFDLKMWRYGRTNWIDPKLIHYHFAGNRGYSRHYTDEFYLNMMVSALVIGGEKWLYKVYDSFAGKNKHVRVNPKANMYDLMAKAYSRGACFSKLVDAKSTKTLDDLLVYFRQHQVAL